MTVHAERKSPRCRTVWCCTCDRSLDNKRDIGPINYLADNPSHYVVEANGDFHVWRFQP
jgi:hypothetical protein